MITPAWCTTFVLHTMDRSRVVVFFMLLTQLAYPSLDMAPQEGDPSGRKTRIVLFSPTTQGNSYWPQVHRILEATAEDLDVELLIYEFDVTDRFAKQTRGLRILRNLEYIDGAIFSVAFGQAKPLLDEAERRNFPVMLQGPLFERELRELGNAPRQSYEEWVGLFEENEERKGYRLATVLLRAASEAADSFGEAASRIRVVGIGGDPSWQGSQERENGLRRAVRRQGSATLLQVVPTQWTQAEGRRVATGLLERYGAVSVIWAASDQLAIGAATAVNAGDVDPQERPVIGGLDLSDFGLREVLAGRLTATVASPLVSYSEVLIYLYDYIHGYDFAEDVGSEFSFAVHTATAENAGRYLELYSSVEEINFAELSKARNRERRTYDFSLEAYEAAVVEQ